MILDCVHHSITTASPLTALLGRGASFNAHNQVSLILVSRILLSALSPQISSSVPTVRPNLVQVTPSLRLSDIRYYLVSITLSTKKPSRGGLVLVWRDSKSLRSQDKPACWMANHSGFVATRIEFCFSVLCFI